MTKIFATLMVVIVFTSCNLQDTNHEPKSASIPLVGTWKLIRGKIIEKGDTTVTDYTKNVSFIKIINDSHFAFLNHDLSKGKDTPAVFVAGGGSYTFKDGFYTEHLEYCSAREWESNDFKFAVTIINDTLIQFGSEKIEAEGISRINIEKYVRVKK